MPAGTGTLVWGTANPKGLESSYNGVYLNSTDVREMIDQVKESNRSGERIPVKLEHTGVPVGHVVSAWEVEGSLQCVLELNERVFEGSIGSEFVRSGICKDLSLGYTIDMQQSKGGGIQAKRKRLQEISIVKKGARKNCHIHGVSARR